MLAKDGRTVWIRDEAVVLEESDGAILRGMHDITDRKQAQRAAPEAPELAGRE